MKKKMPKGTIDLIFMGDLILPKSRIAPLHDGAFQRYGQLFEVLANCDRKDRLIQYQMLSALMLTSLARRENLLEEKKKLFQLKNQIFIHLAQSQRALSPFKYHYLMSKKLKVTKFCQQCAGLKESQWKYCSECQVDRNFYNILAMEYPCTKGFLRIFLANQEVSRLGRLAWFSRTTLGKNLHKEEAVLSGLQYNSQNMDVFEKESVLEMTRKVLK